MAFFPARILLATDGSEEAQLAARAAIEVANKSGSELHALHVGSPGGASPPHHYPGVTVEGFSFPAETMEEIEKRVAMGSISESVVRHAHCPVLVVRGEGQHT
jgi:nucleotide-binding universal stress UspA family protein